MDINIPDQQRSKKNNYSSIHYIGTTEDITVGNDSQEVSIVDKLSKEDVMRKIEDDNTRLTLDIISRTDKTIVIPSEGETSSDEFLNYEERELRKTTYERRENMEERNHQQILRQSPPKDDISHHPKPPSTKKLEDRAPMMKRISHHGRKTPTPTKKKRLAKKTEDIKQNNGTIFDFWKRKNQEHIEAKKRKLSEQIPSNHGRSLRGRASSEGGAKLRDNNNDDCDTMSVREGLNDRKECETRSMKYEARGR